MEELEAAFNPRYSNDRYRYTLTHLKTKLSKTVEQLSVDHKESIKEKDDNLRQISKDNDQKTKEILKRDTQIKFLRKELEFCKNSLQLRNAEKKEWREKCETVTLDYKKVSEHLRSHGLTTSKTLNQLTNQFLQLEASYIRLRLDEYSEDKKLTENFLSEIDDYKDVLINSSKTKDSIRTHELNLELLADEVAIVKKKLVEKCKELGQTEFHSVDLNLDLNRNRLKFGLEKVFEELASKIRPETSSKNDDGGQRSTPDQQKSDKPAASKNAALKPGQPKEIQDVYNTFQTNVAELTERLAEITALHQTEKEVNAKLEDQIADLKKGLEKQFVDSDKRKAELEKKIKSYDDLLDKKDKDSAEEIKSLRDHMELLQAETKYLKQEKTKNKSLTLKMTERTIQAEKTLALQEGKVQQLTKQSREETATLQKQVQHFKDKIKRLEEENGRMKSDLAQYKNQTEIQEMAVLLQHEKDQVKALQKEIRQLKTRLTRSDGDKKTLKEKIQNLDESIVLLHKEKADVQKVVDDFKVKNNESNVLIETEQKTIKNLKEKIKTQSLELFNVKSALSQASQAKKEPDGESTTSETSNNSGSKTESDTRLAKFKENQNKFERTQSRVSVNKQIIDTQKGKLQALEKENKQLKDELQLFKDVKRKVPAKKETKPLPGKVAKSDTTLKQNDSASQGNKNLETEVETLKQSVLSLEVEKKKLEEIIKQHLNDIDSLKKEIAASEINKQARYAEVEKDCKTLEETNAKLAVEISTLKSTVENAEKGKNTSQKALNKELAEFKTKNGSLTAEIETLKTNAKSHADTNNKLEIMEKEKNDLSTSNKKLYDEIKKVKESANSVSKSETLLKANMSKLEEEIKSLKESNSKFSEEIESLNQRLKNEQDAKNSQPETKHEDLAEMNMKLLEEIESLKDAAKQTATSNEPQSKVFFRQKETLQKLEQEKKKLTEDMTKNKKKLKQESDQNQALTEEVEKLKVIKKRQENDIKTSNDTEADLRKENSEALKKILLLEDEKVKSAEKVKALQENVKKLEDDAGSLKQKIEGLENELATAGESQKNAGEKTETLHAEIKEIKQQNTKLKMIYKTVKLQFENLKKETEGIRGRQGGFDKELSEAKTLLSQEKERSNKLKEDYEQALEEKGSLKQEIKTVKEKLSDQTIERDKMRDTVDELRSELKKEKLVSENKLLLEENNMIKKELKNLGNADKVKKKYADLVELNAKQIQDIGNLKTELEAAEEKYEDVNSKVEKAKEVYQKHKETIRIQEARIAIQTQENQTLTKKLNIVKDKDTASKQMAVLEDRNRKLIQELSKSRQMINMLRGTGSIAGSIAASTIMEHPNEPPAPAPPILKKK